MYAVEAPSDERLSEKADAIRIDLERNFSAEGNICALRAKDLGLLDKEDVIRLKRVVVRKAIRAVRFEGEPLDEVGSIGDSDETTTTRRPRRRLPVLKAFKYASRLMEDF